MAIKTILVPVMGDAYDPAAIKAAFSLADKFAAHVVGFHARPDPRTAIPYIGEGMTAEVIQQLCEAAEKDSLKRSEEAHSLFDRLKREAAPTAPAGCDWQAEMGMEIDVVAARSRLADLTVVNRPGGKDEYDILGLLEGVLFQSGRPILVVPKGHTKEIGRTIGIAWNGSAEAATVVAAGLALITAADQVKIVTAGDPAEGVPTSRDLADYLAWHDVKAETQTIKKVAPVGQGLLDWADSQNVDLLILGAYTHSRWREMILGGVTRYMLENSKLPVLLCH